ncbi:hypothetical protein D1B31_17990 [Neobacillus notoginsengisoli]|uniref:PRTRC system protein B n=1 Tax=Neobacillus notoginsengisoli TaxID=1578198 RepID=A0A417YQ55_9BACI|nr:hypothetical protein [Neobacillus notoginsengisoli]RHW35980.1 hypothetical protein D1B31_17990 [Neobacillus notoginsengisoli]
MDFIIKLSDNISDFNGYVEVMQLSRRFDGTEEKLADMVKVNERMVNGHYKMTLEQLMTVISESGVTESISTPNLPQHCIKHVWSNRAENQQVVYVEIPKNRWDITYHNQQFENVGFPRMVFKYIVAGAEVTLSHVFAIKETGFIKDDTPLFVFPFSNVNSDGSVCMGGNKLPNINSLVQISTFHSVFFAAPFGNDYGAKTTTGKQLRELFTLLSNNDFEDNWLMPAKIKFEDL